MFSNQLHFHTFNEVLASVSLTGTISVAERSVLQAAAYDDSIEPESRQVAKRLLHSVRRGWVRVY